VTTVGSTGTITSATFTFAGSVGTGNTFVVRLLIDQVIQGTTCTITGTGGPGTACTISGSFPVTAGQKIMLSVSKTLGADKSSTSTATAAESIPAGGTGLVSNPHTVIGTVTGTTTVTLTGAEAFSSTSSYVCAISSSQGGNGNYTLDYVSSTQFTITQNAGDKASYICIGN